MRMWLCDNVSQYDNSNQEKEIEMAMSLHCWAQQLSLGFTSSQNHNFSNSCSCFFCCWSGSIQKPFLPQSSLSHSLSAAFDGKFQIFLNSPECMCFMSIRNCFTFGAGWFYWPTNPASVSAFSDHPSFFWWLAVWLVWCWRWLGWLGLLSQPPVFFDFLLQ